MNEEEKKPGTESPAPRRFVKLSELTLTPRPERTDEEIRAWIRRSVEEDAPTLRLLRELGD